MKSLVALIICVSLVLVPCFAYADTASGSALTLDDQLWIMNEGGIKPVQVAAVEAGAIKAAAADNTNVFLNGYSMPSSMNFYYFGSGSQATTFTNAFSQLPYLAQAITYSIAYSTQNLNTKLQTALTTLNTAVSNIKTGVANINTSSGNTATNTSNIYSRLGDINSNIGDIKLYTDGVETALSNILTAIQNQSLTIPQSLIDDVDSIETKVPSQAYYWNKFLTNSNGQIPTISQGGVFRQQAFDFGSNSLLGGIEGLLYYGLTGTTNGVSLLVRDVRDNNAALDDYLYDSSLTATLIPRTTIWQNMRDFWTNTSYHLSRLAFVLANDDEIAARQAAAANTAAAVSNVISSSGSGSAKPSDISGIADLKSSVSDSVSTGVNVNSIFTETGSGGHAWDWFTQGIQDELSAPSRRSNVRFNSKSSGSDTPMLDAYYHDLEEAIGFRLW